MKKRKGQWVLITSLLLCIILANIVLLKIAPSKIEDISGTKKPIFENLKTETTESINTITKYNTTPAHIEQSLMIWSTALRDHAENHNTNITGYMIVAVPKDTGYDITISNFLEKEIDTLNITLSGSGTNITHLTDGNTTTIRMPETGNAITFSYILTYRDTDANIRTYNTSFSTTRKIFSISDLTMSSRTEIIRDCMVNY